MAMREKYTADGAAIQYMLAEWDPAALAWKDFRGKVLGATDPVNGPPLRPCWSRFLTRPYFPPSRRATLVEPPQIEDPQPK